MMDQTIKEMLREHKRRKALAIHKKEQERSKVLLDNSFHDSNNYIHMLVREHRMNRENSK